MEGGRLFVTLYSWIAESYPISKSTHRPNRPGTDPIGGRYITISVLPSASEGVNQGYVLLKAGKGQAARCKFSPCQGMSRGKIVRYRATVGLVFDLLELKGANI